MDQNDWTFISQLLQGFGQILSVGMAFYALRLVQNYTEKKDRADFIRNQWNEQALLNVTILQNEQLLAVNERLVYGNSFKPTTEEAQLYFLLFTKINRIHHLYIALKHGILTREDFKTNSIPTVKLMKREEDTVRYLLAERGYSQDFANELLSMFENVEPSEFPGK